VPFGESPVIKQPEEARPLCLFYTERIPSFHALVNVSIIRQTDVPADTRTFVSYINAYIAYYAGNFVTLTFHAVSADISRSGVPRRQLYGFHDVAEIYRVNQPYKTAIRQHRKHIDTIKT